MSVSSEVLPAFSPVVSALISRHVNSPCMRSLTLSRERGVGLGFGLGGPDYGRAPTTCAAWNRSRSPPTLHGNAFLGWQAVMERTGNKREGLGKKFVRNNENSIMPLM